MRTANGNSSCSASHFTTPPLSARDRFQRDPFFLQVLNHGRPIDPDFVSDIVRAQAAVARSQDLGVHFLGPSHGHG
jgi:hypothetical protein